MASGAARSAGEAPRSDSPPAAPSRTSWGSPPVARPCSTGWAGMSPATASTAGPASPCSQATSGTPRSTSRCATSASACRPSSPQTIRGASVVDALSEALDALDGPVDPLPAGREPPLRRLRPDRRSSGISPPSRRVGARRRSVRPVGSGEPHPPASDRRHRHSGLLGDRRTQDPQRALRLRCGHRCASGRPPRRHVGTRELPHQRRPGHRRPVREGARDVASSTRGAGVGRAAVAWPVRRRGSSSMD